MSTLRARFDRKQARWIGYLALLVSAAIGLAGCSSGSILAPEIIDTWQPPEGVEAAAPLSYEEIGSLFAYDAQAPLDIQEEKRWRDGGVTVTDFNYASPLGGRVPATLVVPDGAGPFAGLVFTHDSGGNRRDLLVRAQTYARLGAVGIAISGPSNRPAHDNFRPFVFREQDRREQIQLIIDLRRAIDVLLTCPEIDPQRLAYVGSSYGGAMGGLLAGVEDRLKAYALEVGDGGLVTHFNGSMIIGLPEEVRRPWLAAMWPIEPIHYVGCAAPAALLFQNGTLDTMVSPAALRYQQAGSEPKTIRWYEAGHNLNPVLAEMASTCLALVGAYPTLIELIRFLGHWTAALGFDLSYPPLWGGLCLAALAGTLVAYPLHLWLIRRGVIRWGGAAMSGEVVARKLAWYQQAALVMLSFTAVLGAIFLSMRIA